MKVSYHPGCTLESTGKSYYLALTTQGGAYAIMTLDVWQKLSQVAFYATMATVAVLTFLRARKGLLNTVNTEYHKKVIEGLDELSRLLLNEYDWDSPNHWAKSFTVRDQLAGIHEEFSEEFSQHLNDRARFEIS